VVASEGLVGAASQGGNRNYCDAPVLFACDIAKMKTKGPSHTRDATPIGSLGVGLRWESRQPDRAARDVCE